MGIWHSAGATKGVTSPGVRVRVRVRVSIEINSHDAFRPVFNRSHQAAVDFCIQSTNYHRNQQKSEEIRQSQGNLQTIAAESSFYTRVSIEINSHDAFRPVFNRSHQAAFVCIDQMSIGME